MSCRHVRHVTPWLPVDAHRAPRLRKAMKWVNVELVLPRPGEGSGRALGRRGRTYHLNPVVNLSRRWAAQFEVEVTLANPASAGQKVSTFTTELRQNHANTSLTAPTKLRNTRHDRPWVRGMR